MGSKLNILAYVLCIAVLLSSTVEPASAGFGVSGAILKAEVIPGETISHQMVVSIAENEFPLGLVAEVVGFGQTLDGGCMRLESDNDANPYSANDFLKVSPERFSIEPGTSRELLLEGEIPLNVGAGGRYALVEIRSLPESNGLVGIAFAIDVPVFLTIAGTDLVKTGDIESFEVEEMETPSGKVLMVSMIFKNSGNHHYRAKTEAVLKDSEGNVLASGKTPLGKASIIPMASRLFQLSLETADDLPAGALCLEVMVLSEDGRTLDSDEIILSKEEL